MDSVTKPFCYVPGQGRPAASGTQPNAAASSRWSPGKRLCSGEEADSAFASNGFALASNSLILIIDGHAYDAAASNAPDQLKPRKHC